MADRQQGLLHELRGAPYVVFAVVLFLLLMFVFRSQSEKTEHQMEGSAPQFCASTSTRRSAVGRRLGTIRAGTAEARRCRPAPATARSASRPGRSRRARWAPAPRPLISRCRPGRPGTDRAARLAYGRPSPETAARP